MKAISLKLGLMAAAFLASCVDVPKAGYVQCGPGGSCPSGYACSPVDDDCYPLGQLPATSTVGASSGSTGGSGSTSGSASGASSSGTATSTSSPTLGGTTGGASSSTSRGTTTGTSSESTSSGGSTTSSGGSSSGAPPGAGAGAPCADGSECSSAVCLGGYCCAAPCLTDAGTCSSTACESATGYCLYPTAACGSQSCLGSSLTDSSSCQNGICLTAVTESCAPYTCGGRACDESCQSDADCIGGDFCSANSCLPRASAGGACSTADGCLSGACDGTNCCSSASCITSGACGGSCAPGTGACTYPPQGTACAAASCSGNAFAPAATCDGAGTCVAGTTGPCPSNFACSGNTCLVACSTGQDCAAGYLCNAGSCEPPAGAGAACDVGPGSCNAGLTCLGGACCAGPCTTIGSCGATSCVSGTGACVYPTNQCSAESCASGVQTNAATCANGACPAATQTACAPYVCAVGGCKTACATGADCANGDYCSAGGLCLPLIGAGEACTANTACASAECLGGFCCSTICASGVCGATACAPSSGTCIYPTSQCSSQTCSGGNQTDAANCLNGVCPSAATVQCAPYGCDFGTEACWTSCTVPEDCVAGDSCCGGACVNEKTDNGNCGGCGLVCSTVTPSTAQTCTAGQCLVTLALTTNPSVIAVDGGTVYWATNAGNVWSVRAGGGASTALFLDGGAAGSAGIAVDANNIYWTQPGIWSVTQIPLGGGAATTIATMGTGSAPTNIGVASGDVYWAVGGSQAGVWRAPIGTSGAQTRFITTLSGPTFVVNSNSLYCTGSNGYLLSSPLGGGAVTTLATGFSASTLVEAVDSINVYLTLDANPGVVGEVPIGGGNLTTLASGQDYPAAGAVDPGSGYLYWANTAGAGAGSIAKVPVGGGAVTTLISGRSLAGGLALDGTSVYWTESSGVVMKLTPR